MRVLLLVATAALLGCGPVVMIPGGALSGPVREAPSDWSFSDAIEGVQLETRPSDPYSVNVWGVAVGPVFYIASGDADSRWALHIAEDPRVRLKLEPNVYELRATLTDDPAEHDAFLAAVQQKYDYEPDPEQRESAALFRLEPR